MCLKDWLIKKDRMIVTIGAEVSKVKYRCKLVTLVNEGMLPLDVNVEMLSSYKKGPALHTHGFMHNSTSTERFLGETLSGVFVLLSLCPLPKSMVLFFDCEVWFPYGSYDD